MTGVKINGEFLVLDQFKVTFEIENSAFTDDLVFSGLMIPGEAPVCPINNSILQNGYNLNIREKVKQYPCEFFFKGHSVYYGTFNLLETSRQSYRWNISISGISAELLGKKLSDINLGTDIPLGANTVEILETINDMASLNYPGTNFCFPQTANPMFYGAADDPANPNPDFKGTLNWWNINTGMYIQPDIIMAPSQDNQTAFSPWVFTQYLLRCIFATAGWDVTGTFVSDPNMQQHIMYGGRALDRTVEIGFVRAKSSVSTFTSLTPEGTWIPINMPIELIDPDNRFASSQYTVPYPHADSGINEIGYFEFNIEWRASFLTPDFHEVPTVIYIGILFEGDDPATETIILEHLPEDGYTSSEIHNLTESRWFDVSRAGQKFNLVFKYEQASGDVFGLVIINDFQVKAVSLASVNLLQKEIHPAHHVPDITVAEFLIDLRDNFNLTITPDLSKKAVVINYFDRVFTRPPKLLTINPLYDYNSTFGVKSRYIFNYKWSTDDARESDNFKLPDEYIFAGEFAREQLFPPADAANKVVYSKNTNRYFLSVKDPANNTINWKYFADKFKDLVVGEGDTIEKRPQIRPVFMASRPFDSSYASLYIHPFLSAKGNSPCFGTGTENKQPLKMAFWRGMQPNANGVNYPFATSYTYNDAGVSVWPISLRWDEPVNGIYDKFWQNRVTSIQNSEMVEFDAISDSLSLSQFDITAIYSVGDVYYAIKLMRITFGEFDIEPVEFETYRLL